MAVTSRNGRRASSIWRSSLSAYAPHVVRWPSACRATACLVPAATATTLLSPCGVFAISVPVPKAVRCPSPRHRGEWAATVVSSQEVVQYGRQRRGIGDPLTAHPDLTVGRFAHP